MWAGGAWLRPLLMVEGSGRDGMVEGVGYCGFLYGMMKKRPSAYPPNDPPRRVLDAIRDGRRTWEEIAAATRLSDRQLGLTFIDLLARKKLKIVYREGVRLYLPL